MTSTAASERPPVGKLTDYTFTAEQKHESYGLRPGSIYRGKQDEEGRTFGRPVLVHDPNYPAQPTLRGMLPFSEVPLWLKHDKAGAITGYVREDDPVYKKTVNIIHAIDLSLVLALIAAIAIIVTVIAL
jgi:hypothetical protein